jgi:hypothetical protein
MIMTRHLAGGAAVVDPTRTRGVHRNGRDDMNFCGCNERVQVYCDTCQPSFGYPRRRWLSARVKTGQVKSSEPIAAFGGMQPRFR